MEKKEIKTTPKIIFSLSSWEIMQFSKMVLQMKGRFQKKVEEIYICQIDTLVLELWELQSWETENIPEAMQLFTEYFEIKRKICLLLFQLYLFSMGICNHNNYYILAQRFWFSTLGLSSKICFSNRIEKNIGNSVCSLGLEWLHCTM